MKPCLIFMLSIGCVFPADTLLTKANMLYPGELIELTETHAVFQAQNHAKPQQTPLKVVQFISSEDGNVLYGDRVPFTETTVAQELCSDSVETQAEGIPDLVKMLSNPDDDINGGVQATVYLMTGWISSATLINISNTEITMLMENEIIPTCLPLDMVEKVLLSDGRIAFPYNVHQLTRSEYSHYYSAYKPSPGELARKYLLDGIQLGGTLVFLGYPGAGDEWAGTSLFVTVPVFRYFAFRGGNYSLSYASGSECDCEGSEYQVLAGTNFTTPGLKLYVGRGRYEEQFTNYCRTSLLSGGFSLVGAGYHLNHFGVDVWASTRDASDYKAQINASYGHTEVTEDEGSTLVFMLSFIF